MRQPLNEFFTFRNLATDKYLHSGSDAPSLLDRSELQIAGTLSPNALFKLTSTGDGHDEVKRWNLEAAKIRAILQHR